MQSALNAYNIIIIQHFDKLKADLETLINSQYDPLNKLFIF